MGSGLDSPVNDFLHVWSNQVPLTEYSYARAVSFQNLAMLYQLLKLHLRKLHQAVDLVFRSIEVLDAKGIDRDDSHTTLVAYFQYLGPVSACYAEQSDISLALARASNPRPCPSMVSILWLLAKRRFPSMTNATCWGIGPWLRAPIKSSRTCLRTHSAGGELKSQSVKWERYRSDMVRP